MHLPIRSFRFLLAFLLAASISVAHAQLSLAQLRQDLIAPWLVTVEGGNRSLLLRINEISQDTEGSFLVSANFGWIDGPQTIVRLELIQSRQALLLIMRTNAGSIYSFSRTPGGDFAGTFGPRRGEKKAAKLEKLAEDQIPGKVQESNARMAARVFANEDKDWGIPATRTAQTARLHSPTPTELPGAKTMRTMELKMMLGKSPAPVLLDVLDASGSHRSIPGAHWLREPGKAAYGSAEKEQFRGDLEKLTAGHKSAPLVFFCVSSQCWLSYNAGLRAVELGYTNVYWFRGGMDAWRKADFETKEAEPYQR